MFRIQNRIFWFLLTSFQQLVLGNSIKTFPHPSFGSCWFHQWKYTSLSLWDLSPIPLSKVWVICDKSKLELSEILALWSNLCGLLLLEVKPSRQLGIALELPSLWWAVRKFVKICFASARKEAKASEVRIMVERDSAWSWLLVGNSSYLNGDIGIMCDDFELQQPNSRVNPLVCLLVFFLSVLLE
jgi:hypothetical protein